MRPLSRTLLLSLLLASASWAADQDAPVTVSVPRVDLSAVVPSAALNPAAPLTLAPAPEQIPALAAPAVSQAPAAGQKQKLIDTLSAAQPELGKMGQAESAQAAERDFNARAQLGGVAQAQDELEGSGLYDGARIMAGLASGGRNWYYEAIRNDPRAVAELRGRVDGLTAGLENSLGEALGQALAGQETRGLAVKSVYAHGSQLWGKKGNKSARDTDVLVVVDGEVRQKDGSWSGDIFSYKPGAKSSDGRDFDLLVVSEPLLRRALAGQVKESFGMPVVQWEMFRGDGVLLGGKDVLAGDSSAGALLNDVGRMLWNAGKKMELLIFGSEQRGLSPNTTRKVDGLEKIPPKLLGWLIEANLVMDRLEPLYGVESKPLPGIGRASEFWPRYFETSDPQTLLKEPLDRVVIQLESATDRRFEKLRSAMQKQGKPAKTKPAWRFW